MADFVRGITGISDISKFIATKFIRKIKNHTSLCGYNLKLFGYINNQDKSN